jgi:hypothetical protein
MAVLHMVQVIPNKSRDIYFMYEYLACKYFILYISATLGYLYYLAQVFTFGSFLQGNQSGNESQ